MTLDLSNLQQCCQERYDEYLEKYEEVLRVCQSALTHNLSQIEENRLQAQHQFDQKWEQIFSWRAEIDRKQKVQQAQLDVVLKSAKESLKKKLEILETFKSQNPQCDEKAELAKLGMTVEEANAFKEEFKEQAKKAIRTTDEEQLVRKSLDRELMKDRNDQEKSSPSPSHSKANGRRHSRIDSKLAQKVTQHIQRTLEENRS